MSKKSKVTKSAKAKAKARKQLISDIIMIILVFVIVALCFLVGGTIVKDIVGYAALSLEMIKLLQEAKKLRNNKKA